MSVTVTGKWPHRLICFLLQPAVTTLVFTLALWPAPAVGQSTTEAHLLFGSLKNPSFAGGGSTDTWTDP